MEKEKIIKSLLNWLGAHDIAWENAVSYIASDLDMDELEVSEVLETY